MTNAAEPGRREVSLAAATGAGSDWLSPEALIEFDSLKTLRDYPPDTALFAERKLPENFLFLITGEVKLSMNARSGRRVILDVAYPGESLGLASSFSGTRYEFTAETASPCRIASLPCADFHQFLSRHPSALMNVARELCLECSRACEKVRKLGLTGTAPAKLARFLLDQRSIARNDGRTRLLCSLTHEEIGETIGVCRETVSRLFSDFRCRELVECLGPVLIISDRRALEAYTGIE